MKSCPTCNRTFEDTFTFCLIDGSILSAPFDPAKPEPPTRASDPQRTEVLRGPTDPNRLPETKSASPAENLQSTIAAPFAQPPIQRAAHPFAPAGVTEASPLPEIARWMFILRGGIAILFGILLLLWRG